MGRNRYAKIILFTLIILSLVLGVAYRTSPPEIRERVDGYIRIAASSMRNMALKAEFRFVTKYFDKSQKKKDENAKDDKKKDNKNQASATLVGSIYDELSKPIVGATVTIMGLGKNQPKTQTDKDGKYKIADIPPGTGHIVASHPGFVAMMRPHFPFYSSKVAFADLTLPIGSKINGTVLDEERKPLKNVEIQARHIAEAITASGGDSIVYADIAKQETSKDNGTFLIKGMPLGSMEITAKKTGYAKLVQKHVVTKDNATSSVELILKRSGILDGQIKDAETGAGIPDAKITLESFKPFGEKVMKLEGTSYTMQSLKPEGKFRFEHLFDEGFYDIKVEHPDYAPSTQKLIPCGTEKMTINMVRGSGISGKVTLIDRVGDTGVAVSINIESVIKGTTLTLHTVSTETGDFKFDKLPYGSYKIWVNSKQYSCLDYPPINCEAGKPPIDNVVLEAYQICSISGRVISAENGMPIPEATVTINSIFGKNKQQSKKFMTKTSSMGKFVFEKLPSGQHTATAEAKGFVQTNFGTSAETFYLLPGESKNDLTLQLYKGGTVDGRVLDANGSAVKDADVQLYVASTNKRNLDTSKLVAKSNENGWYTITGIDVGDHLQLYASARAEERHAKGVSNIIDLTAAVPSATADIIMPNGGTVQGRVTDMNGIPIAEAQVSWHSGNFPGDPSPSGGKVSTESNGTYRITHLPPGRISLNVSRSGYVGQGRGVNVKDNQVLAGIDFKLKTGKTITGVVMTAEGNPIPNANVRTSGISGAQGGDSANTDKDGKFTLGNLGEGSFKLNATFSINTQEGNQNYNFFVTPIKAGSEGVLIECDVDNSASTIVDAAGSGRKIQNFFFRFASLPNIKGLDFSVTVQRSVANTNGLLKISNIPRGVYKLTVTADGYEKWEDESVYIGPNRRTSMPKVHLEASGGIMGKVVSNKTGRPVNGVRVSAFEQTSIEQTGKGNKGYTHVATVNTDYAGEFLLSGLSPATHRVILEHSNYSKETIEDIPVTRRKIYDMGTIILEAGGTVLGTIRDETGAPCAGFTVAINDTQEKKKTTTDRGGNYLMQGVEEGTHIISVQGTVRSYRPTYTFASTIIIAGESTTKNFTIGLTANMVGQLFSATPLTGASGTVSLYPFDENNKVVDWIRYDATIQGMTFSLNQIPPGQYFMWAGGNATAGPFRLWQFKQLTQGDNTVALELPPSSIKGRAIGSAGQGLQGTSVQLRPLFDGSFLSQTIYNKLIVNKTTNATGAFSIPYIQQGTYQIIYQPPGGRQIVQQPMSIGYGQTISGITLPAQ